MWPEVFIAIIFPLITHLLLTATQISPAIFLLLNSLAIHILLRILLPVTISFPQVEFTTGQVQEHTWIQYQMRQGATALSPSILPSIHLAPVHPKQLQPATISFLQVEFTTGQVPEHTPIQFQMLQDAIALSL